MELKVIIDFTWSLIKQETGTAVMWTLIGSGAGLLLSIILVRILWMFFKDKKFLSGKLRLKWPKYLLLTSWILIIPLSCVTAGAAWGAVTAAYRIAENQKAIEETVSLAVETSINETFLNILESPELSREQKALLFNQHGDTITVSTLELDNRLAQIEDMYYEAIQERIVQSFSDSQETEKPGLISLPQSVERRIIDSLLQERNPALFVKKGRVVIGHAKTNFGTQVTAKELGHSLGATLVKPHVDKEVKNFKVSIIIALLIQLATAVLLSIAVAALLVWIVHNIS